MADFTSGKNWSDFYSGILPAPAAPATQPATDWNQFYSGILPSSASPSVTSPYLTPAEQAQLQQQMQQSQTLQAGYNPNGTPKPPPIRPSWTIPNTVPAAPSVTSLDQAAYDARHKPGTWMAQSRMQAQALMRQMALRRGAPAVPQSMPANAPGSGIASLVTGKGTPRAGAAPATGGLLSLLFGGQASPPAAVPYNGRYTPQQLADRAIQGQAIGDANRHNPNPTYTVSGDRNDFQPTSVQNSVRWQTGY